MQTFEVIKCDFYRRQKKQNNIIHFEHSLPHKALCYFCLSFWNNLTYFFFLSLKKFSILNKSRVASCFRSTKHMKCLSVLVLQLQIRIDSDSAFKEKKREGVISDLDKPHPNTLHLPASDTVPQSSGDISPSLWKLEAAHGSDDGQVCKHEVHLPWEASWAPFDSRFSFPFSK